MAVIKQQKEKDEQGKEEQDQQQDQQQQQQQQRVVVFIHPDLGIGGAERLVVDAAVGLQQRGHRVVVFTGHCDARHCFDEARDGMFFFFSFLFFFLGNN